METFSNSVTMKENKVQIFYTAFMIGNCDETMLLTVKK